MADTGSAWTPWVWAALAFNLLFSTIFCFLALSTFTSFKRITDELPAVPVGISKEAWGWLFDGAAVSAFFALIILILFACFSIYYMLLSRKPLSHPRKKYGKGVLVATSLFTALHIANIATHFLSFTPLMNAWVGTYGANFNRPLLVATWGFGYISAAALLVFTIMLTCWRDREAEAMDRVALSHSEQGGLGAGEGVHMRVSSRAPTAAGAAASRHLTVRTC